jgi:hypothetical protein
MVGFVLFQPAVVKPTRLMVGVEAAEARRTSGRLITTSILVTRIRMESRMIDNLRLSIKNPRYM